MATYVVGDIQGCFFTLQKLLKKIRFDPSTDRLLSVGDLVNRGPASLEVLRFLKSLGKRFEAVLGNHDLHLLGLSSGVSHSKKRDTLLPILRAQDLKELIDWLRHRPLLHFENKFFIVHAGLHPYWSFEVAQSLAKDLEKGLQKSDWKDFLNFLYHPESIPAGGLDAPVSPLRDALTVFTRIRMVRRDGSLDTHFTGPPEEAPADLHPWFAHPERQKGKNTILFGHWAALGFRKGEDWLSLDSGCVWGKKLTVLRLDDQAVFQEDLCDTL